MQGIHLASFSTFILAFEEPLPTLKRDRPRVSGCYLLWLWQHNRPSEEWYLLLANFQERRNTQSPVTMQCGSICTAREWPRDEAGRTAAIALCAAVPVSAHHEPARTFVPTSLRPLPPILSLRQAKGGGVWQAPAVPPSTTRQQRPLGDHSRAGWQLQRERHAACNARLAAQGSVSTNGGKKLSGGLQLKVAGSGG